MNSGLLAMMLSIAIGQARPTPPPTWLNALKSPNPKIRQEAISLSKMAGAKAVVPLVKLLFNSRSETYQTALQALRATVYNSLSEGQASTRRGVVDALFSQLPPNAKHANAVRTLLIELLSIVTQEQDVPRLATYLKDPLLREPARIALTALPYPSVNRLLIASLPLSPPALQVGLIQSIEEREIVEAVPSLQALLSNANLEVRLAALHALGRLPDIASAPVLWNMLEGTKSENRQALQSYLTLAETLLQHGDSQNAHALYTRFFSVALTPTERCSALTGLVRSDPRASEPLLMESLRSQDHEVRGLAVRLLSENPAPSVTQGLLSALPNATPSLRPILVQALSTRDGSQAREAIMQATLSQASEVRTAAFRAMRQRPDINNATRLQVYHRALPVASSDTERLALLTGIQSIGSTNSLSYLFDNLVHKGVQTETWTAIFTLANQIGKRNRREEAITIYERIVRFSENDNLIHQSIQRLRELGSRADFAAQAGYIEHWWVLGALPGREVWRTEDVLNPQLPIEVEQPVSYGKRQLLWRYLHLEDPRGILDFTEATPLQGKAGAYAYAEIAVPSAQDALLKIGSDDDYFCWLNGVPISRFVGDRGWKRDEDVTRVRLTTGVNRILVKVLNAAGAWQVSVRLTDVESQPLLVAQRAPKELVRAERSAPNGVGVPIAPNEVAIHLSSGLEYVDIAEGKGEVARNGDNVSVHYTCTLLNGKRVSTTRDTGEPLFFTLGNDQVIAGFDEGIRGMKPGGKRRLIVPPALAYGDQGMKNVPPNATVIFEVELISVEH